MRLAPLVPVLAVGLLLAGCSGGAPAASEPAAAAGSASTAAGSDDAAATGDVDVCALAPADLLEAAIGADPGEGTAEAGSIEGSQCTWAISDTSSVILQYTPDASTYLPDGVFEPPADAAPIPGTDRGFANAATRTILLVEGERGVLLNVIDFGDDGDQAAFEALAEGIAANL